MILKTSSFIQMEPMHWWYYIPALSCARHKIDKIPVSKNLSWFTQLNQVILRLCKISFNFSSMSETKDCKTFWFSGFATQNTCGVMICCPDYIGHSVYDKLLMTFSLSSDTSKDDTWLFLTVFTHPKWKTRNG